MSRSSSTDLVGRTYNRWTVLRYDREQRPHHYYICRCSCGCEASVQANSLKQGTSKSCGCHRREVAKSIHTTHGATSHPAYQSWVAMRRRCTDPSFEGYPSYGGRGIAVCHQWRAFEGFWSDMGSTWSEGLSIDRIDNDGDYEPSNCRWATDLDQANNKRNNSIIWTPWGKMTRAMAARRAGISYSALKHRIERGWPQNRWLEPSKVV